MSSCQYCKQPHHPYEICDENPNRLQYEMPEMVDISKSELIDLILYADIAAKILKENGFPGKAEALEKRYMKFKHLIT